MWGLFKPKYICAACGEKSNGKPTRTGSSLITLIGLLFAIIPGLLYEFFGRKTIYVCKHCGKNELVLLKSPKGKKLAAEYDG